jgi:hypothetical protein
MKRFGFLSLGVSLAIIASPSNAQNSRFDGVAQGPKEPVPFRQIAVCAQSASTGKAPCSPLANLCSSFSDVMCVLPDPVTVDNLDNNHFYPPRPQARFTFQTYGTQLITPQVMKNQTLEASWRPRTLSSERTLSGV